VAVLPEEEEVLVIVEEDMMVVCDWLSMVDCRLRVDSAVDCVACRRVPLCSSVVVDTRLLICLSESM
jgi:hypothetical protein